MVLQMKRHLQKRKKTPLPFLSPKGREALKPPTLVGKEGRGVRSACKFVVSKSFPEMSKA
jgi:hypothetical protein